MSYPSFLFFTLHLCLILISYSKSKNFDPAVSVSFIEEKQELTFQVGQDVIIRPQIVGNFDIPEDGRLCVFVFFTHRSSQTLCTETWLDPFPVSGLGVGSYSIHLGLVRKQEVQSNVYIESKTFNFKILPKLHNDTSEKLYEQTKTRHGPFMTLTHDNWVSASLRHYGQWSEGELTLMKSILGPGCVTIDAGANIGAFTIPIARYVGSTGAVYAFEPQQHVFVALASNVALNQLENVRIYNAALGQHSGIAYIPHTKLSKTQNFGSVSIQSSNKNNNDHEDLRPIEMISIDQFVLGVDSKYQLTFTHLDFIKIDVEGSELKCLKGAHQTIEQFRPLMYIENDRVENSRPLIVHMQSIEYDLFWSILPYFEYPNYKHEKTNIWHYNTAAYNMLAIPKEKVAKYDVESFMPVKLGVPHPLGSLEWIKNLAANEYRIHSPNGEDGVLSKIFYHIKPSNQYYVELLKKTKPSIECKLSEKLSITKLLRTRKKLGWNGVLIDDKNSDFYSKLTTKKINNIFIKHKVPRRYDLLSINIGFKNDSWLWETIDENQFLARVVVVRINSFDGKNNSIRDGTPTKYHHSSLKAFVTVANTKQYHLIYCESHGMYCFFIHQSSLNDESSTSIEKVTGSAEEIYREQKNNFCVNE